MKNLKRHNQGWITEVNFSNNIVLLPKTSNSSFLVASWLEHGFDNFTFDKNVYFSESKTGVSAPHGLGLRQVCVRLGHARAFHFAVHLGPCAGSVGAPCCPFELNSIARATLRRRPPRRRPATQCSTRPRSQHGSSTAKTSIRLTPIQSSPRS